jgi:hypothetical protein
MAYLNTPVLDEVEAWAYMADVTGANVAYTIAPIYGEVVRVKAVRYGTIAGTDNVITVKINGTAITGGTISMETTADAAGDTDEVDIAPHSTALCDVGSVISFHSGGEADDSTTPCMFCAVIRKRRH